jgi:hypothetical protein
VEENTRHGVKSFEKYMHDTDEMKKMKEMMKGYHDICISPGQEKCIRSCKGIILFPT